MCLKHQKTVTKETKPAGKLILLQSVSVCGNKESSRLPGIWDDFSPWEKTRGLGGKAGEGLRVILISFLGTNQREEERDGVKELRLD